jgi:Arc/MetJ-type ribon-helix-helix transcriptional regulator
MKPQKMGQVSFRIPKSLIELVGRYLEKDTHVNPSEFFREALREKIRREAPQLYSALFEEAEANSA